MLDNIKNVKKNEITMNGANKASIQVLIGENEGWDSHVMRVITLEAGGNTPKHTHDQPHINYIIEGEGILFLDGKENKITQGSFAYVPPNELHQFKNVSNTDELKFMCIVPK